ncbi:Sec-independent protein translocase TatA [Mangrovactinospora gilvigrisea]|uniref:Sec-independent protein translocase protein TatA n=1 Tax=Mangrovactinospora gilvigrisea TaxID=1428644 RepID=A0A1J7BIA1_9ACTN|nr:Sec-independent protein translocase subunit TatA [Mangrovactinospora gilvigrisea]OIV38399.1 Sec-independent protein translocase TatA [Mangrovactinospora gilvigrisea]
MALRGYEILIIALIIVLLFGAKKLPDMARSLGKSARILKSETAAMKKDGKSDEDGKAEQTATTESPKTIQAAPGDVSEARPVGEKDKVES